ncbi:hypothetical protein TRFO_19214 [Tritrichomonas foetus]|uniref:Uncharacterized protein n=1 Tax=Tritrichomonas foetus TaxID=1144522 RepID=A0A1J4KJQ7_9EUKA|nr:hypothetical protein TRFO_19214 [Tritrichomonas foetus]|eukprot:OHT11338.1 hypothetical protein TRFO_19214 [Tritrichomonas foetus]
MNNLLASIPPLVNKKAQNANSSNHLTPLVIKANHPSSNFNQSILNPVATVTTTAHQVTTVTQPMARKNVISVTSNQKSTIVHHEHVQKVVKAQPTQDDKICSAFSKVLTKYKRQYLLSLFEAQKNSPKEEPKPDDTEINEKAEKTNEEPQNAENEEDEYINNYIPPERKKYPDFDPKSVRQPIDIDLVRSYFLDKKEEEQKTSRLSRRQNAPGFLPQYETWIKIGHGYLINPNPPDLFEDIHFVDFFCQNRLKALAMGGEGTAALGTKDDQAPLLASIARLQFSMIIDEHGIEHLKIEEKLRNAAYKNAKQMTIDKLAKLRHALELKIREYNDDIRNKYRNPPVIPFNSPETAKCFKVKLDQLQFLHYAIRMIELTSGLTPKHSIHITRAFSLVLPLLLRSVTHPGLSFHFVGKKVHFTFFFRLFHLLNRLLEYFKSIPMIPFHATFGLIDSVRADITTVWQKELHHISDNIEYGGCLSWILCEMRDISLALTMHLDNVVMIEEAVKLHDEFDKRTNNKYYQKNYTRPKMNSDSNESDNSSIRDVTTKETNDSENNENAENNNDSQENQLSTDHKITDSHELHLTKQLLVDPEFEAEDQKFTDDLIRIASREDNGRKLYTFKFIRTENNDFYFTASSPSEEAIDRISKSYLVKTYIPPFYPFVVNQSKHKPEDEELPTYVPDSGMLQLNGTFPSTEMFGQQLRIRFEPFSTQSLFSLNIAHDY